MKKKFKFLLLIVIVLAAGYAGNKAGSIGPRNERRIHQHREYKKPEESFISTTDPYLFATHLPIISINTQGQELSEDFLSDCKIDIIDTKGSVNRLHDGTAVSTWAKIKWRGNSSARFDKKQYRITFVEEKGSETEADYPVMGMKAESDWVLNAPYLDKTLMRNYMMYNISGEIMDWAPNVRFCEMFLDGSYMGVYLMIETIKVSPSRLDLKEVDKNQTEISYLLERERFGDSRHPVNNFGSYTGKTVNEVGIEYPTDKKLKSKYEKYIKDDLSAIEKALYSLDYDEWDYGYAKYLDVNSFIDYYIINEFSGNVDAGALSTYAYKDIRGKLTMGPVWDFNNCFDNYKHQTYMMDNLYIDTAPWYIMLMRDEIFVERLIKRYHQLRETVLSDEYLLNYIDETITYLGDAVDRNFEVWGYTFDEELLHPDDRNLRSYEEAVEQLKNNIVTRGKFLDEHIDILKQFCAESNVKEYN